ncbi:MAG: ATP-dependent DNA helicase [Mobiluncus porci]|uniref:ATP-dependent DNA helicase n=2 Tax=Mobiluncus porci TaxID=2652278 RepID=UPI0023F235CC|nr:ATP-dependent DNA helicase [Mobiluncus porci]MDD7540757.1 ATP-dependent DNA helicase [Mobiluncus porci]
MNGMKQNPKDPGQNQSATQKEEEMEELFTPAEVAELSGAMPPTEEQEAVIAAPLGQVLVIAGAGSGKTETIANRLVYWIVNAGIPPENALGLTFTRKAAGEMSARFMKRLEALAEAMENSLKGESNLKKYQPKFITLQERGITPEVLRHPVTSSTYDSYASALLGEFGALLGRESGYAMITDAARFQIMSDVVETYPLPLTEKVQGERTEDIVKSLLKLSGDANAHLVDLDNMEDFYKNQTARAKAIRANEWDDLSFQAKNELAGIRTTMSFGTTAVGALRAFEARKRELLAADFSDQTRQTVKLVETLPKVGETQRDRYRMVFLDEFQDTSVAQMRYLAALFADHAVTAVGDPNQSIYGWRGASAASMEDFASKFASDLKNYEVLSLSTSWRNGKKILEAANRISEEIAKAPRPGRRPEGKWEQDPDALLVKPLSPRPDAPDGFVHAARTKTDTDQAKVLVGFFRKWLEERRQIRADFEAQLRRAKARNDDTPKLSLPTAAVLCRGRSAIPAIASAFEDAGIPYQTRGLEGILSDPGVKLVRATMMVCANPDNSGSLLTLLDRYKIGLEDLKAIGRNRQGLSVYQVIMEGGVEVSPEARWRLGELRSLLLKLRDNLAFATPLALARMIHRLLGLDIEAQLPSSPLNPAAFSEFLGMIRDFQRTPGASLQGFLSWLEAGESEEASFAELEMDVNEACVQILTIHAAKGLEWDYVAIPNLNANVFPSSKQQMWLTQRDVLPYPLRSDRDYLPDYQLETFQGIGKKGQPLKKTLAGQYKEDKKLYSLKEEARLAYVAFTRAKTHLLLTSCWFERQNKTKRSPSPFFLIEQSVHNHIFEGHCAICEGRSDDSAKTSEGSLLDWVEDDSLPPTRCLEIDKDETNPNLAYFEGAVWPSPAAIEHREDLKRSVEIVEASKPQTKGGSGVLARRLDKLLNVKSSRLEPSELFNRVSATGMAKLGGEGEAYMLQKLRPLPQEPSDWARLGTIFHAWAENQLDADQLDIESAVESRLPDRQKKMLREWKQRFRDLELLRNKRNLAVESEGNLIVGRDNPVVLKLRMDAVFEDLEDGKIWIVDWKTGTKPQPEMYSQWVHQLGIYRLFWCQSHPETKPENVVCAYVFLSQADPPQQVLTLEDICAHLGLEDYTLDFLEKNLAAAEATASEVLAMLGQGAGEGRHIRD